MYLFNNLKFDQNIQRTVGDTQYPAGWFNDPLECAKIGAVEVPDPIRPDDALFTSVENPDGSFTATPRTAADLAARFADAKANAISQIDGDTDNVIRSVIGERGSEYELAEREATAYRDAGYTGTVPGSVSAWATAKNWTATAAADSIIATAIDWRSAQATLRAARLLRKEQVRVAVDGVGLDSVKAQWVLFLAGLRAQLTQGVA